MTVAPQTQVEPSVGRQAWLLPLVVLAALVWSYWTTLAELMAFWRVNEDYSVGQLVPVVAAYLFYREGRELRWRDLRPNWFGLVALLAVQVVRLGALLYDSAFVERFTIIASFSAALLLVAGWQAWWRLRYAQLFLLLMLPLPSMLHDRVALPLQNWATTMGFYGLELCGFIVRREGNVLHMGPETSVGVDEACSGLRMLTAFIFTAAVLVFLVDRPMWQKLLILASAAPIAVLCNGVRVLATSVFYYYVHDADMQKSFHDWAGIMMMPLAVLVILGELKLLAVLFERASDQRSTARNAAT